MITVDARGLACPLPLLKLKQALNTVADGEQVMLLATDAGSWRDVRSFAELSTNELVSAEENGGEYVYIMQKSKL